MYSVAPRIPTGRQKLRTRIFVLLAVLALMGVTAAVPDLLRSATAQKSARRTSVSSPRNRNSGKYRTKSTQILSESRIADDGSIIPGQMIVEPVQRSMNEINADQEARPAANRRLTKPEFESPRNPNLPAGAGAVAANQWPLPANTDQRTQLDTSTLLGPQTLGTQFDGATGPTETGAFPPDTMGAVGPTQFFVFLNGRMRTFNKTTGVADGVVNVDSDVFFAAVLTPPLASETVFTSDPNVRFDRLSNRRFLNVIDVIVNN